jgi:transcriptional regulator with XRE-family HTH domain
MDEIASGVDARAVRVGARIRQLRHARKLTLVEVAERSGLSHPFLSQLERGLARPSMGSLSRIAHALGSSELEIFAGADEGDDPDAPDTSFVPARDGHRGAYGNGEGRLLVHGDRRLIPMEFRGTNTDPGEFFEHEEHEFIHVLSGRVRVDLGGRGSSVLAAGDSLYFSSGIPHRWSSEDGKEYRMFVVKEGRR